MTSERPPVHAPDWRHRDPVQLQRDHERNAVAQIVGITGKIARLQQALADRQAALKRIRAALAQAILEQRGPSHRED